MKQVCLAFHHSELCFFSALFFQHKDAYQVILDGVKGGTKEKRLAAQFIPKFFKHFPELADSAINAQLDLCEDEDVSVSLWLMLFNKFSDVTISRHCMCIVNILKYQSYQCPIKYCNLAWHNVRLFLYIWENIFALSPPFNCEKCIELQDTLFCLFVKNGLWPLFYKSLYTVHMKSE